MDEFTFPPLEKANCYSFPYEFRCFLKIMLFIICWDFDEIYIKSPGNQEIKTDTWKSRIFPNLKLCRCEGLHPSLLFTLILENFNFYKYLFFLISGTFDMNFTEIQRNHEWNTFSTNTEIQMEMSNNLLSQEDEK